MTQPEHYILATGGKDTQRLQLLHDVHGPGTEALLRRTGLRVGMRVAEIGCGSGNTACWVAEQVGPTGSVLAVDISPDQIDEARQQALASGGGERHIIIRCTKWSHLCRAIVAFAICVADV